MKKAFLSQGFFILNFCCSEEGDNPRRKLVEEWLEKNSDICPEEVMESAGENSQDTVLLECDGQSPIHNQNEGATSQAGGGTSEELIVEHDVGEHALEDNVMEQVNEGEFGNFKDCPVKQESIDERAQRKECAEDSAVKKESVVLKQECVGDSAVKKESVEERIPKQEVVEGSLVNQEVQEQLNEAGTSTGPIPEEEPLLQCPLCWKNFEKVQTQVRTLILYLYFKRFRHRSPSPTATILC